MQERWVTYRTVQGEAIDVLLEVRPDGDHPCDDCAAYRPIDQPGSQFDGVQICHLEGACIYDPQPQTVQASYERQGTYSWLCIHGRRREGCWECMGG